MLSPLHQRGETMIVVQREVLAVVVEEVVAMMAGEEDSVPAVEEETCPATSDPALTPPFPTLLALVGWHSCVTPRVVILTGQN